MKKADCANKNMEKYKGTLEENRNSTYNSVELEDLKNKLGVQKSRTPISEFNLEKEKEERRRLESLLINKDDHILELTKANIEEKKTLKERVEYLEKLLDKRFEESLE